MATSVILVDDHPLIRKGIRTAFESADDIVIVGEAGTGDAATQLVRSEKPDVVLLDVELPDTDGVTLLGRLRETSPQTRFVMLSVWAEARTVQAAMDGGASGFLTKSVEPTQLIESVRDVVGGRTPLCAEAATHLVSLIRGQKDTTGPHLTEREREVWDLVCQAATNSEIAAKLFISQHTVKFHIHNILQKLGAKRRTEAVCAQSRGRWD